MALTPAQLQTLKTFIAGDATLNAQPNNGDGNDAIRMMIGLTASPDFWVWKTSVALRDLISDPAFDWTRVDNLSVGKSRILEQLEAAGTVDPSQPNVRAGFSACFSAAGDAATLAAILSDCRRKATRVEKLFATGTGSTGSPAIMTIEGGISTSDIESARNLP